MPSHIPSPQVEESSLVGEPSGSPVSGTSRRPSVLDAIMSGDEGDHEGPPSARLDGISKVRDFEAEADAAHPSERASSPESHKFRFKRRKHKKRKSKRRAVEDPRPSPPNEEYGLNEDERAAVHRVGFVDIPRIMPADGAEAAPAKSRAAFMLPRAALPRLLSQNVFVDPVPSQLQRPRSRRASSLPDLRHARTVPGRGFQPSYREQVASKLTEKLGNESDDDDKDGIPMSRTAAVVMLLVSTGLVALCAEFLVDAIPLMTKDSAVSQAFIGLIILPIVGNAAEHVTAVTVAAKNKMDLSIGVAVGSSIQIGMYLGRGMVLFVSGWLTWVSALFVTPLVVILGWAMNRDMSLYFTLFETVSLFVTVFVVNFLVLDGRSNYLEGALLIACYIIIA
jgi:Ca2+:H+ antiporter